VRQGLDRQTGEFLRQRHGADRIASNGEEQSKACSLYDMTFSAPKSVSVTLGVPRRDTFVPLGSLQKCGLRTRHGEDPCLYRRSGIRTVLFPCSSVRPAEVRGRESAPIPKSGMGD
jgi:hypothetical protein